MDLAPILNPLSITTHDLVFTHAGLRAKTSRSPSSANGSPSHVRVMCLLPCPDIYKRRSPQPRPFSILRLAQLSRTPSSPLQSFSRSLAARGKFTLQCRSGPPQIHVPLTPHVHVSAIWASAGASWVIRPVTGHGGDSICARVWGNFPLRNRVVHSTDPSLSCNSILQRGACGWFLPPRGGIYRLIKG